jgi:hypothetical protein
MSDRHDALTPESLPGPGEIALPTAIDSVLDVPASELPGRVALARRYIGAALDAIPGSRRARFLVIAQLMVRDVSRPCIPDEDLPPLP